MSEDLGTRIRTIVVEQLGVEPSEVTPNASILDDLGADSLDVVEWAGARGSFESKCRQMPSRESLPSLN